MLLRKRLHRGDGSAAERLLRRRSRDPSVPVRNKRDALVGRGVARPADRLADGHDEPNPALPVWRPDGRSGLVPVCGDVTGAALRASRARRL